MKAEAEKLPDLPQPLPECCSARTLKVIERGYTRCTTLDEPDPGETPQAYTNGWNDYSEAGDFEWVECLSCGKRWKTPEGLDYV